MLRPGGFFVFYANTIWGNHNVKDQVRAMGVRPFNRITNSNAKHVLCVCVCVHIWPVSMLLTPPEGVGDLPQSPP